MNQVLQAASLHAKSLNKSAYFFAPTEEGDNKIIHVNFVAKDFVSKKFNAKTWIADISTIVGGKVRHVVSPFRTLAECLLVYHYHQGGGKDESTQGVGTDASRVDEALAEAEAVFTKATSQL